MLREVSRARATTTGASAATRGVARGPARLKNVRAVASERKG
jgi:hypothetical protein